jgi:hypothetical protein
VSRDFKKVLLGEITAGRDVGRRQGEEELPIIAL